MDDQIGKYEMIFNMSKNFIARGLKNYHNHHQKTTGIYKQLSIQDNLDRLAKDLI